MLPLKYLRVCLPSWFTARDIILLCSNAMMKSTICFNLCARDARTTNWWHRTVLYLFALGARQLYWHKMDIWHVFSNAIANLSIYTVAENQQRVYTYVTLQNLSYMFRHMKRKNDLSYWIAWIMKIKSGILQLLHLDQTYSMLAGKNVKILYEYFKLMDVHDDNSLNGRLFEELLILCSTVKL